MAPPRRRLDAELVRRGLVSSRSEAQEAIVAGLVTVDGAPALKAAAQVHAGQAVRVTAPPRTYVSRGGDKLEHGLGAFGVDPTGRHCLDAGVSTGGFTDCLLRHGAAHVVAVDVGYGQVHERVRTDPRVTVRERTNVRELRPDALPPPPPDLVVADLSFISLATVLPTLRAVSSADANAVLLVKPQFEARRSDVGKGGVVRDPQVWRASLLRVAEAAAEVGWWLVDAVASPLLGPAGNVEFLVHLVPERPRDAEPGGPDDADQAVADVVARAVEDGRARRTANGTARHEQAGGR